MVSFKVVIGNKEGKCVQKEIADPKSGVLFGKKIGDKIDGSSLGFDGYEFEITGGSDFCGIPMRKEVPGSLRKQIFATHGVGLRKSAKGIRVRKTVCGNTIHDKTAQINLKVLVEGSQKLIEAKAPEAKEAAAAAE